MHLIKQVTKIVLLDASTDNKLSWASHIDNINISKVLKSIYFKAYGQPRHYRVRNYANTVASATKITVLTTKIKKLVAKLAARTLWALQKNKIYLLIYLV